MMQGSKPRIIGLLNAGSRLVHEKSDQANHVVLTGHVNGKPSLALVDNGLDWIKLGNASHGGIFVQFRDGVAESTRRVGRRRCQRFGQLVKMVRSPLKHDCDSKGSRKVLFLANAFKTVVGEMEIDHCHQ
jgi:hypothetical protein